MKDIHDVINHAKFGDDRLRGSGVVAGQISAFPIDFAGRPYNTLTLPCERVIGTVRNGESGASEWTHRPWGVVSVGMIITGVWMRGTVSAMMLFVHLLCQFLNIVLNVFDG